jgi:sarcosine oxidase
MDGIRETYEATGVPYEKLDRDEIAARFPQFNLPQSVVGLYQADYSLLAADRCVAALAEQARQDGATLSTGERVLTVRPDGDGVEIATDRRTIRASRVVIAAGSWISPLLRGLGVALPIRVLKEQLAFFRARNREQFVPGRLPLVIHRFPGTTSLGSVFPIYEHEGVKIMIDRIGPEVEPDDPDRTIDQQSLSRLAEYACDLIPDLTGEIIEAVSCRYTMTPDEDFAIDLHPEHPQIVIASACSGHGFKFAVVIGEILADLAISRRTSHPIERFRIDRYTAN